MAAEIRLRLNASERRRKRFFSKSSATLDFTSRTAPSDSCSAATSSPWSSQVRRNLSRSRPSSGRSPSHTSGTRMTAISASLHERANSATA